MDYNLQGLSPRSFEQLIQALAAKIIGPQTVIFGDGPDGGREAVFEGAIPYPSAENSWTGYGVVQAKFKQRLQGVAEDGAWAAKQLRSELNSFLCSTKRKKKPDYYIFVTNVILTPVAEIGSKDQCIAVFNEFASQLPLKGYDIWDYDKLRVFLDDNEEIRKGYSAWITSGDVLAEVIKWVKTSTPDFEQTLTLFLEKELLSEQYVNLEQAGHSGENPTSIGQVFVDLPAHDRNFATPPLKIPGGPSPGIVARMITAATERLDPQSLGLGAAGSVASLTATDRKGRYVITGGPGQGKTTIAQFICQLFRASILQDKPKWSLDPETRQFLRTITSRVSDQGLQLPTARRFPVRIVLSKFASALAGKEELKINSVLAYIVHLIHKRTDKTISPDDFREWLKCYPWVVVFDGLDEVPASSNRDAVLSAIRDFRIDARNSNADLLTIGTTRPQGYNDDFSQDLHHHLWLAPLSTPLAMHYAKRLVDVRYGSDTDRVQKILNRLSRAAKNEATARLMQSPLQVTIMATLVDRMGQPPQERWNLFKGYYNVIYQREVERDTPTAEVLRGYQTNVDTIHNHVGLLLQLESERSGQTDASLSLEQFEAVVESHLKDEGHSGEHLKRLEKQIMEAATDRLVFLVGLQANKVGFEIRSLQEFMAAEALMAGTDEQVRKRLREIAPISSWRNVFLFAAGKCFVERQHLRDTIHVICSELNDDSQDRVLTDTLTGSRLALDLLEDGPARRQPKYAQSLARIALRLLDQPPQDDQVRLSTLYESELDPVYEQEFELRISHVDRNRRLGVWRALWPLLEKKIEWARKLAELHWVGETSHQFDVLLVGTNSTDKWYLSKIEEVIPQISPLLLSNEFLDKKIIGATIPKAPTWLKAINKMIFYEEFQEALGRAHFNEEGVEESLSVGFIRMVEHDWMVPLMQMPAPAAGWRALLAGVEFAQSPSTDKLVSSLRYILDNSNDELRGWLTQKLPWPLAWAVSFCNWLDIEDVEAFVVNQKLGNTDSWAESENRWLLAGFDVRDLLSNKELLPLNANVATQGFPFPTSITITIDEGLVLLAQKLLNVYRELADSATRCLVAGWVLFAFSSSRRNSLASEVPSLEQLRDLIIDSAQIKETIYLDVLGLIDFGNELNPAEIDFFDWLGLQEIKILIEKRQTSHLSNLLVDALKANPNRTGLLRSLWIGMTADTKHVPISILNIDRYEQEQVKQAALGIRLEQGQWGEEEMSGLAQWSAQFINSNEVSNTLLENTSLPPQVSWEILTRLLIEIRSRIPSSEWKQESKIVQRLNDSIRRRISRIGDTELWTEMGLPPGLVPLLPKQG